MKSKNIPADIKAKSLKEAQSEITDIIESLEAEEVNLEESKDKYSRMLQLNDYIREEFMKKNKEIRKTHHTNVKENSKKNKK
jgi:exonuclease VII small subunit